MDPFRDPMMREALRQAREMRELLDNRVDKSALELLRQNGRLFDHRNRMMSSPEFQFLRATQDRDRHLDSFISSPAFSAIRDFLMQNDVARRLLISPEWSAALDLRGRRRDLFSITNVTTARAISEVTQFINNNLHVGLFPQSFAAEVLSALSAIEEPTDEQSLHNFIAGLENLLTLIVEKCTELAVDPTTYLAMAKFAFTIFVFLYPLYVNHLTEKRVTESINQTRTQILSEVEKLKPTQVNEVYYVVEREAKLKSQPQLNSPTIQILSPNQRLKLVKAKGKWIHVEYFDYVEGIPKSGWVLEKFTKRIDLSEVSRSSTLQGKTSMEVSETALLSEEALAEDWDRPEEDAAWSHLQQVP